MNILYVSTISNTINAFMVPHIKLLIKNGHTVDLACKIEHPVDNELIRLGCKVYNVKFQRKIFSKNNVTAYEQLKDIVKKNKYDIVHTHTPIASAIVRLALKYSTSKIFYTAHGFHFYKGAKILNWLVYYPIERYLSKYTDTIITINKEDYIRATQKLKAKNIKYMPSVGLNLEKFNKKNSTPLESYCQKDDYVIISIGELNKNKNHETIIKALAELQNPKIKYIICGEGPLKNHLENVAKQQNVARQVKFLGFRNDIVDILSNSDLFAFPSKREGLGMAALEAMAVGLPIVTSNIHGIKDYSINEVSGYCLNPNDYKGFAQAIDVLYKNREKSEIMGANNLELVKKYSLENALKILMEVYK